MGNSKSTSLGGRSKAKDTEKVYEIRQSEGKGLGMFATCTIKPGEIILCERPLIRISEDLVNNHRKLGYNMIPRIFNQQTSEDRARCMALTWQREDFKKYVARINWLDTEDDPIYWAIWQNNAYTNNDRDFAILSLDGARINHSCVPNATFDSENLRDMFCVRAVLDVQPGQEIFISYVPLMKPREKRQEGLGKYGFICDCALCRSSPKSPQEINRCHMEALHDILKRPQYQDEDGEFDFHQSQETIDRLLEASNKIITLLRQEPSLTYELFKK